jgi:two-component system NarL family response regulator
MDRGEPTRILIVDDHPVVRAGLASMLGTQPNMVVAGSAASGEEALSLLDRLHPDVILLDIRMPGMNGVDFMRHMRARNFPGRIVVLTSFETDEDIYRAIEAGAHAYLLKNTSQEEMLEAIRTVHADGRYFPPRIAAHLAERLARSTLTPREHQILELLAKGLTNKQIGTVLRISEHTARNHVNSILDKLDVADRTEAVVIALQQGLVSISQ